MGAVIHGCHRNDLPSNVQHKIGLQKLKDDRRERQLNKYLYGFFIRNVNISGIGPAKKVTLGSYGVETAADVSITKIMSTPGFGQATAMKIVQWRKRYEASFKYDSQPNAQDIADERALRQKIASEKTKLSSEISIGHRNLNKAKRLVSGLSQNSQKDRAIATAFSKRAQAEQDLIAMKLLTPVSVSSFDVTVKFIRSNKSNQNSYSPRSNNYRGPTSQSPTIPQSTNSPNCPQCGKKMLLRMARRGRYKGSSFWGCSGHPQC